MFELVHKHRRIVQVVLALLAIPFALWGIESYTRQDARAGTVAKVNGIEISQREFDEQHRIQQDRLRQMFGRSINPDMLDTPESRKRLLDSLIEQRVVSSAAVKANLTVTDDMLRETIAAIPAFQAGGEFNKAAYETMLRTQNPPMSPAQFEARLRHDLALQQLTGAVAGTAIPSRTVADRLTSLEAQKREISITRIPAQQFAQSVKIDEAKVKAHYDANQGDYRVPERIRAEYLMLSAEALAKQEKATEEEVKAAYDARSSAFKVEEQRRASHILVKTKEEADKLVAELKKSPGRFAELAKKHSTDTGSAEKGGDLGLFGRGMMVKPFEDAVFQMKAGETSGPVQSEFGFHIIRLAGVEGERARPYEEVKKELTAEILKQKAARKFAESAEQFSNVVYEQPDSLKPAAERLKLNLQTTNWVARSAAQELGPLDHPKLLSALFSSDSIKNRRNTDAIEIAPNTLVAARVMEHQPAAQRKFEEVKAEVEQQLRRREAAELAKKDGEAKLEALRKGGNPAIKWEQNATISRREPQGMPADLLRVVVTADVSKLPAYVGMPLGEAGYALVRISKVSEAGDADNTPEAKQRLSQLIGGAQYASYVASLKSRAEIDIRSQATDQKDAKDPKDGKAAKDAKDAKK